MDTSSNLRCLKEMILSGLLICNTGIKTQLATCCAFVHQHFFTIIPSWQFHIPLQAHGIYCHQNTVQKPTIFRQLLQAAVTDSYSSKILWA
jgi:hypothetical protein